MISDFFRSLFWGSHTTVADTGLLCAMAFSSWVMNLGRSANRHLFRHRSAEEVQGQAARITVPNLHIVSAMPFGMRSLSASILCALLFGGAS
jgi:hypothetical protein